MKTELKIHGINSGQYTLVMDGEKVALMMGDKETALKNAKIIKKAFDTSERLDHLRQQLEELRDGAPYAMYSIAYSEAISLIDQLKAETKNT